MRFHSKAFNLFTPTVKPQVIQSLRAFDSMDTTLKSERSLKGYRAVPYCGPVYFSMSPLCNFGKFDIFGIGTLSSVRVEPSNSM